MSFEEFWRSNSIPKKEHAESAFQYMTKPATVQQRLERQENEKKNELRWDPGLGKNVSFNQLRRETFKDSQQTPEALGKLFEQWDLLDIVNREALPLQCAVGPAVPLAFKAVRWTWLLFLLVPVPVYFASYETVESEDVSRSEGFLNWMFHLHTRLP